MPFRVACLPAALGEIPDAVSRKVGGGSSGGMEGMLISRSAFVERWFLWSLAEGAGLFRGDAAAELCLEFVVPDAVESFSFDSPSIEDSLFDIARSYVPLFCFGPMLW